ncbi:DUF2971 domain-containing protein [Clostridium ganghwense]|uniref:DUF2971 domain-containing protein n=1 Tax=Clostridium ganghwense TaxID=312089 RepID=A0ABT4CUP2_9CLOT|nr:DUF2971 domain-containing protein [Clostridium ganghwense]MCY6372770.1 DUF2971 domain-containing protein [Clostridium ganghwense]
MGYTLKKWVERVRNRTDMSAYVTHLTREQDGRKSIQNLIKILEERKIIGSNNKGFICGENRATCFQDVPMYSLGQNTLHEQENRKELGGKVRYKLMGLAFDKRYVYMRGGRPVIYENSNIAKKFIDKEEWWRIVSFDLSDKENIIDWTHEREWRVKGDFEFELKNTYVILVNHKMYRQFMELASEEIKNEIKGIIVLQPVLT